METRFIISPVITRNFDKCVFQEFLAKYRLCSEFNRSGKEFHDFAQELVDQGKLPLEELEKHLKEELYYGNQRSIYMYELFGNYHEIQNAQKLLQKIQENYPYVDSLRFCGILEQPFNDEITDLVSVNVVVGFDGVTVQHIKLLFAKKCTVSLKDGMHGEYSYVTVEIDFIKKRLLLKVKPKTGVVEEMVRPVSLVQEYYEQITKMFKLVYNSFSNTHKQALCEMNSWLYEQTYNKVVLEQSDSVKKYVEECTQGFLEKLNIKDFEEKKAHNNIFDISDMLTKMVEHIQITNILYDSKDSGELEGVDGFVTYIKFSDGTNISARIRGENYTEPIFSSEAFMALRASISNAKKISILKTSWLNEYHGVRVSYDATDSNCLGIHLYKRHTKEDFDYAVKKYKECEERIHRKGPAFFAMEA